MTWKVSNIYDSSFMLISSYCIPLNKVLLKLLSKFFVLSSGAGSRSMREEENYLQTGNLS